MNEWNDIVREEMRWYTGNGYGANCRMFMLDDKREPVTALLIIDHPTRKIPAEVVMLARVVNGYVVIDEDNTDKPLVKALVHRGIPRDKTILSYAGEQIPDAANARP